MSSATATATLPQRRLGLRTRAQSPGDALQAPRPADGEDAPRAGIGVIVDRENLLQDSTGLHNIWGMQNASAMAALSLGVMALFATVLTAASIRVFTRSALR